MPSKLQIAVASMVVALAVVIAGSAVHSCTGTQAGATTTGLRVIAGTVDLPGVNEAALEEYLSKVERRFDEIEARKPGQTLGWSDWIWALFGGGATSAAATGALLRANNSRRSQGRAALVQALVDSMTRDDVAPDEIDRKLARANLAPKDRNAVQGSLSTLRAVRKSNTRSST